jgi:adenylate cyclase
LQVDILTLFLTLFFISFVIIIAFSYSRNSKAILEFSKGTIQRVSASISDRIECILYDLQQMPILAAGMISDYKDISSENKPLVDFMLTAVKAYPNLHAFFIGTPEGNFIEANDLTMIIHTHYLADPSKPLPKGISYALRVIDYSKQPPLETWTYKDASFNTITQESFPTRFDPRTRPWYLKVQKTHKLSWTDVYVYDPTGDKGIAVAMPIHDAKGELLAIIGTDLPLTTLEKFLSQQQIGKTGKAFILDSTGKIVVPQGVSNDVVAKAFKKFKRKREENFFQRDQLEYLIHIHPFPEQFAHEWWIAIIAPLNDFFGNLFKILREAVLVSILILILVALIVIYFSKRISKPIVQLTKEVDKIKHLDLQSEKRVESHIREISLLDSSIHSMRVMLRSFGRYVPKEIVRQLMEQGQEIALGGEKKEITVLFTDIVDFTPIAESNPIEEVMPPLEAYFDTLSKIILDSQGTIDKYIGDSIMAFWGAPTELLDHTERACTAALVCQQALASFNQQREREQKPEFLTRIGIHTGEAIVGNIGTTERMNYTAMGDVVNAAARLQQVNKTYHTSILISEEVYKKIETLFLVRPLGEVAVKGKVVKIKIYELVAKLHAEDSIAPTLKQTELCTSFTHAYELYSRGELAEAKRLFQEILQKFPHDFATQFYLEKILSTA